VKPCGVRRPEVRGALRAAAILLAAFLAAIPRLAAADPAFPDDAEIRRLLAVRVDQQQQATGIVIGLVGPQGRRVLAYGTAAAGGAAVDGDTLFDIGSVTKVFTALLLADMASKGEVKLDDPVVRYLPAGSVRLPERGGRRISLLDLATHTSGLPLRPGNLPSKDPRTPYAGYTVPMLYRALSSLGLEHDIGSRYQYSNLGYGLLAQALAQRGGQPFAELLRRRITSPLGMEDTGMGPAASQGSRLATGYDARLQPEPHWDFGALEGAGGLRSTANDLLKLLEAALGMHASPLAAALKLAQQTRRPGADAASAAALGWNVDTGGAHTLIWKNGSVGGFRSFIGYDPSAGTGVVALANAHTALGADDIALHLLDSSRPVNLYTADDHHAVQLEPQVLERYTGRYRFAADRTVMVVSRAGGRLWAQQEGQQDFELHPEGESDFFLRVLDIQLHFVQSAGPVKELVMTQDGKSYRARRIR
jgi:CubicO group peptidase (beta-lactamase class C family)